MTITSNRNATNMIKRLKPKPKDKPTVGKWSKMVSELTEEVVLDLRLCGNTFLRVTISPVSGCIGKGWNV